jgi:hypothetical protein
MNARQSILGWSDGRVSPVVPLNIVETEDVRMVQFCTVDGSVLITCSRRDGRRAILVSPQGC